MLKLKIKKTLSAFCNFNVHRKPAIKSICRLWLPVATEIRIVNKQIGPTCGYRYFPTHCYVQPGLEKKPRFFRKSF